MDNAAIIFIPAFLISVWVLYSIRAWWLARNEWESLSAEIRCFYLLVAPPLILGTDVLVWSDQARLKRT